jgi:hypothetical protein
MVEKWRAIAFKYFGKERFDGGLGKNSSRIKKKNCLMLKEFPASRKISQWKLQYKMKEMKNNRERDEFGQSWMQK